MKNTRIGLVVLGVLFAGAFQAAATDYYVSPSGADHNSGTSPTKPWKSIGKVNAVRYAGGDRIYFQGGATFAGRIYFDANDGGTAAAPITVSSYGTGRATINAGTGDGLFAYNTDGLTIESLNFVGAGATVNTGSGIDVYADVAGGTRFEHIYIDNVDASGFGSSGISVGSWNGTTGYRDVMITNSAAHDNGRGGVVTYGAVLDVQEDVYVDHVSAYGNTGVAGMTSDSGNGIVLGSVNGAVIQRCVAHDNGTIGNGGVGIWTYDSTNVVIQYNESYNNHTAGPIDGDGFDLDQNTANSVMQYNYSHGNDGAGFLVYTGQTNKNHTDNIVRYNISQNDGRKNGYAGIYVGGKVYRAEISHNTVYVGRATSGYPAAVRITGLGMSVHLRDNIFQTANGVLFLKSVAAATSLDLRLQGNDYWPSGAGFNLKWGSTTYTSLAAWLAVAADQERVNGTTVALNVDPALTNPGGGGTFNDADLLANLVAYQLQPSSPLIDAGLDLLALFGVNEGPTDFYGTAVPQNVDYDVGAHEAPATP